MTAPTPPTSTKKTDGGRIKGAVELAGAIEAIWFWTLPNGRKAHTITHADNSALAPVNVALANTLFTALLATWGTNLASFCFTGTSLDALSVRDMASANNAAVLSSVDGESGTAVEPALPSQIAVVLTGQTGFRGKGTKARYYLPGWAENASEGGGVITAALLTAFGVFGPAMVAAYVAAAIPLSLLRPERQEYFGTTGTHHSARLAELLEVTAVGTLNNVFDTVRARVKP